MHITPIAKAYLKSIADHQSGSIEEVWLPCIGWDGTEITLATECPWRCAAGVPSLPPMFIKIDLGFEKVPYLLIEPNAEAFFRNATIDLDKDKQLMVVHRRNRNCG